MSLILRRLHSTAASVAAGDRTEPFTGVADPQVMQTLLWSVGIEGRYQ
jgi:hypothetical protein